jgi:hypothetical protein
MRDVLEARNIPLPRLALAIALHKRSLDLLSRKLPMLFYAQWSVFALASKNNSWASLFGLEPEGFAQGLRTQILLGTFAESSR